MELSCLKLLKCLDRLKTAPDLIFLILFCLEKATYFSKN